MTDSVASSNKFQQPMVGLGIAGILILGSVVAGCGGGASSRGDGEKSVAVIRQADEIEQIATAMEASLEEAELGTWRVVDPVTFRHGVLAGIHSPRVATISFTCMFPITIDGSEHENLVRHDGRFVFHKDQWRLEQVAVSFRFFNEDDFTAESDLLVTSLVDGGKLTMFKAAWETTVRDTVELQLAQRQLDADEAEKAEEEAAARKQAEADAEKEAKRARAESLTEAARLRLMTSRLKKIAMVANSDLGPTVEGVEGLRFTGEVDVEVELVDERYQGRVTFQATPRSVAVEYTATRFGRPWVFGGLETGGGWDALSRASLTRFLDKRLTTSEPTGN